MCLFASFMIGAAAGYMARDYAVTTRKHGKKSDFVPLVVVPKCVARKAKKLKKELQDVWEDML